MTTAELIEKLELADGPSFALLQEVWDNLNGGREYGLSLGIESFNKWIRRRNRFQRLLEVEAWTDAAMTLVPEWRKWMIVSDDAASVFDRPERGGGFRNISSGTAITPAIALCIAALKAKEADNG